MPKMSRKEMLLRFKELDLAAIRKLSAQTQKHRDIHCPYNLPNKLTMMQDNDMKTLCERLLQLGGNTVKLPDKEEDIQDILQYGQVWDNTPVYRMHGRDSQCHANSAELWYNNRNAEQFRVTICTGYALSADGIWRQHSWLIQMKPRSNRIIETTEPRLQYYGFAMTYRQSEDFEYWNS